MPDGEERLEKVEQGLTELRRRMDERFAQVDKRLTGLQVLVGDSASQIKLVAEVQGHHGETLQRLNDAVEPLKTLQPLFEKVVKDHEDRITALERARQ